MEQICQLSKSVSCPPQALAYQAHLSLSCPCLLISMCISLSLPPPRRGDSRTGTECKSHSLVYILPAAKHWKRVKGGRVVEWREINQSEKHETVKTKPKDEEIILIYLRVRIPWDKGPLKNAPKHFPHIFCSYDHREWSQEGSFCGQLHWRTEAVKWFKEVT